MADPLIHSPVARSSLVDELVERLRADVLAERYAPGTLLPPERELAAGYGVTRTSLKHALVRLVEAGLLETRHGIGTRVRDFRRTAGPDLLPFLVSLDGPSWLAEVFAVRREIGALIAARAARHAGEADRERLLRLRDEIAAAPAPGPAQRAEAEVHRALAVASGNRVYELLVNSLLRAYDDVRELFAAPFADAGAAARRITPLVEAVHSGDPAAAHAAADAYYLSTERLMLGGDGVHDDARSDDGDGAAARGDR
ncbi:FadR/GntR family transcriptional regulator [Couchioplanes caeruleus subsp. azureus]|uniref:FadR/GntR family transcriptional regulator n=1 Tax=Couchioplanes caeruleus TaxID=56438 RepID=UPI00361B647C